MDLSGAVVLVPENDGHFIDPTHKYIAQIIQDYDPYLELQYIPPEKRVSGDKPFAVIHRPPGKPAYFVFYAEVCDQRILERLWSHDNQRQDGSSNNVLSNLEAKEAATKAIAYQRFLDEIEESNDLFAHALKKETTYSYKNAQGDLIRIRD